MSGPDTFEFVYFTDTHVAFERNVAECREMLGQIRKHCRPVFAINGGDVTEYGWAGEFDNYQSLIAEFGVKTYDTAGNHDVRWSPQGVKIFRERLGEPYGYFTHQGCHFLILDSTVPLSHWGHYEKPQLRWLEYRLDRIGREEPIFVTTHHWVGRDDMRVDNEEDLRRLLEPYNVRLIFNGHGHNDLLWQWDGTACTMNRGLYQGSWERISVDRASGEVRLDRWRKETQAFERLATIPLAASRANRRRWSMPAVIAPGLATIPSPATGVREYRWNFGKWEPVGESGIVIPAGVAGYQNLALRNRNRQESATVLVTSPNARIQAIWSADLSGGVMSHLRVNGDHLLVSAMDGSMTCLEAESGRRVWRSETGGYCHSSATVVGDIVLVGSADAHLYAFARSSGALQWKLRTGGPVYASATVIGPTAVFGSGDGCFYGVHAADGKLMWRKEMPKSNTSFCQSVATTDGKLAFIGAWDSHLYAIDPTTGETAWRRPCQERTFAFSPAISSPCVADGRVFVAANGNGLFCFDAASGEPIWMVESPGEKYGHSSPRPFADRLVVGCLGDAGEVRCLRRTDGAIQWTAKTGGVIYDSSPAIGDAFCAIGSVNGTLNILGLEDGRILAQYRLPTGHFLSTPAARGDRVWAASYCNQVFGFRISPG